jgi:hypothetical protein
VAGISVGSSGGLADSAASGSSGGIADSAASLPDMRFPYSTILWKIVK